MPSSSPIIKSVRAGPRVGDFEDFPAAPGVAPCRSARPGPAYHRVRCGGRLGPYHSPQNRHHGRLAGAGGETVSPAPDAGEARDSTARNPPHSGHSAVNMLIWEPGGLFGNTT